MKNISIIAAAALTILPELLREYADYRMLVYAIVLIVVMLCTWSPKIKNTISLFTYTMRTYWNRLMRKKGGSGK